MEFLVRITRFLNRILIWIATVFLGIMILLSCMNILFRLVWVPVRGTFELMGYFGAIITASALGYTQSRGGHIAVDILVSGFSKKVQRILNGINCFICMSFFAMAAWQITKYATILLKTGEVTETLHIIYYPFTYAVGIGCAVLSLVFLTDFLKAISQKEEGEE